MYVCTGGRASKNRVWVSVRFRSVFTCACTCTCLYSGSRVFIYWDPAVTSRSIDTISFHFISRLHLHLHSHLPPPPHLSMQPTHLLSWTRRLARVARRQWQQRGADISFRFCFLLPGGFSLFLHTEHHLIISCVPDDLSISPLSSLQRAVAGNEQCAEAVSCKHLQAGWARSLGGAGQDRT